MACKKKKAKALKKSKTIMSILLDQNINMAL